MSDELLPPIVIPDPKRVAHTQQMHRCLQEGHTYFQEGRPASACIHDPRHQFPGWEDVYRLLGYVEAIALALGEHETSLTKLFDRNV